MYADFVKEHSHDYILETEIGFVQWRYLNENQAYIVNIWTNPDYRKLGKASDLADVVVERAKNRGCKELLGTVYLKANNASRSMAILSAYGMEPVSADKDIITYRKAI